MFTEIDNKIIEFLDEFRIASTSTIHELFCKNTSLRNCQYKLRKLIKYNEIKRKREHISDEYVYYVKYPKQTKHSLVLTNFYRELHKMAEIVGFKREYSIGNLRADAIIGYKYQDMDKNVIMAFVEVQTRKEKVDVEKYERLYYQSEWKNTFDTFPQLIAVTNKKVNSSDVIKIIKIREDLTDISKLGW